MNERDQTIRSLSRKTKAHRRGIGADEGDDTGRRVPLWAAMLALVGTAFYFGKGR